MRWTHWSVNTVKTLAFQEQPRFYSSIIEF